MWSRIVIIASRLRFALSRQRVDDQVRREFEGHIDLLVDRYIRAGMTREEAEAAARRQFGNALLVREEIYDLNSALPFLDTTCQDLRYGLRLLRQNPTFSLVAILTLTLGIGANAAIFQLVNALRLRSLPVEKPYELVSIGIDQHGKGRVGRGYPGGRSIFTEPLWQEIRSRQQAFSSLFAWGNESWDLSTEGEAALSRGLYVNGEFFGALGVHAHVGRVLTEADDRKG